MAARRSYGTGSLIARADSAGRETWYGQWHTYGRRVKRRIGPKRAEGARDGLTRTLAEADLRRLMSEVKVEPLAGERLDVAEVTRRYWGTETSGQGSATRTTRRVAARPKWSLRHFVRATDSIASGETSQHVAA